MEKEYSGMTQGELDDIKRNLVHQIIHYVSISNLERASILLETLKVVIEE